MSSRHLVTGCFFALTACAAAVNPSPRAGEPSPDEANPDDQAMVQGQMTSGLAGSEAGAEEPAPSPPPTVSVEVTWSAVSSSPGCFFFSGPAQLGRDDQLGGEASWSEDGGVVSLRFGERIVFRGSRTGASVTLVRRSSHDYDSKWDVEERIDGTISGNVLTAAYEYHECDMSQARECPSECEITAQITIPIPIP